jgi:5'-nucleotidase
MKRILICNDDGYLAPGIVELFKALKATYHVEMVAPEQNNSAKSNALTLLSPLTVHEGAPGVRFVNGTPADCVHIALTGLLGYRPDLVVSGINNGANMGEDTIYSGTVAAAMEGYMMGIPAIAFSQVRKGWDHLSDATEIALDLVHAVLDKPLPPHFLLNVNIPNLPRHSIKGIKSCRLGRRHAAERVHMQTNPRGETMYWIGGAGPAKDDAPDTDFHATANGFVSLTPLMVDLTEHASIPAWGKAISDLQRFT